MPPPHMQEETDARLRRFQNELTRQELDGALVIQKANLYYFSATDQDAVLWVPAQGPALLLVRKSLERAQTDSPLEHIVSLPGLSRLPEIIQDHTGQVPARIGLELDTVPAKFFFRYQGLFPKAELADVSTLIRTLRMIKSPYEIGCITRAAEMADRMYEKVPEFLRESRTETDLAARVEGYYRSLGHPGLVRTHGFNMECVYGQILAGADAAAASNAPGPTGGKGLGAHFSQGAGWGQIRRNEPVIIDHAANVEGYIADQTRVFSLGRLPEELERAHRAMVEIQEALAAEGRPGAAAAELYRKGLEMAGERGFEEGFMGHPDPVPFVAHGVGLEIDDWPVIGRGSKTVLQEGMTLAVEPKVVFPGRGVVGVENTFRVTATGMKKLNRFPDEICVC